MHGQYGIFPRELAQNVDGAQQFSPLIPTSLFLDAQAEASLDSLLMAAPPGTVERRFAMAAGLRALKPGAAFTVMAPNKKGGTRLRDELRSFGCEPVCDGRHHWRICEGTRPATLQGVDEALDAGRLQQLGDSGLWSQPGVFSWDKVDAGTALLLALLPPLSGKGADLGAGIGLLSLAALTSPNVSALTLVELDGRAVAAAQRNVTDTRADIRWEDIREVQIS
ncbi:MAG: methyltransferase, partial [Rickettsiales bacterium]|nr:methyltransferase [Rickettsiales bacterium]